MRDALFILLVIVTGQVELSLFPIEAYTIGSPHDRTYSSFSKLYVATDSLDKSLAAPLFADLNNSSKRRNRLVRFIIERFHRYGKSSIQRSSIHLSDSRLHMHTDEHLHETPLHAANDHSISSVPSQIFTDTSKEMKNLADMKTPRTLLDWMVNLIINAFTFEPTEDLKVRINPSRKMISSLVQGEFRGDISIQFKKIYFQALKVTGGGTLKFVAVRINFYSWILTRITSTVQQVFRMGGTTSLNHRFPSPFKLQADQVSLTNDDLLQSSCIRMGLRNLFRGILKSLSYLAPKDVIVQSAYILPNEKVSCQGIILLPLGTNIPFEIRSGIKTSHQGHVIEFPGLEILLSHVLIPIIPEVAVYLGENFRFMDLEINSSSRLVQFSAKAKIIPRLNAFSSSPNLYISEKDGVRPQRESYPALAYCDAADWIRTICQF